LPEGFSKQANREEATMKLKVLAISDTHLGEETSLLSFPQGLQHVWRTLAWEIWPALFPEEYDSDPKRDPRDQVEIEELVLIGDIADRTLSSTSQIYNHCHAFSQMMGSVARIKKGVYVPGNHDHTMWTDYVKARSGGVDSHGVTPPGGDTIVKQGVRNDKEDSAEEILATLLGFPIGWAWWNIAKEKDFDLAVANPAYVKQIDARTYVFTHGTLFRPEIASPRWMRSAFRLIDVLQLDWLANLDLEPLGNLHEAENLEDLERLVAPFVDSLWPSSKNNPTSRSDELWFLFTLFRGGFDETRAIPDGSRTFSRPELLQDSSGRIGRLTEQGNLSEGSLKRWREYFLPLMPGYLEDNGFPKEEVTFVYGDTHAGGWGELSSNSGEQIRVYNCGGWTMSPSRGHHPACHIFAVDEAGEEYLFDISFKGVKIGDDNLLDLAARDSEHRYNQISIGARLVGEQLRWLRPQ
jgi:Calcineurin-like phosphoesterase